MGDSRALAARLVAEADECAARRRALLTAATALSTTNTLTAARKALADPFARIPSETRTAALDILADHQETP